MNILPFEKQIDIIAHIVEGCSLRATGRLVGAHRDSVMHLGERIGRGCGLLHDRIFRDLNVSTIEIDELWSFVGMKQKQAGPNGGAETGDQYIFTALDAVSRCLLKAHVGKRDASNARAFVADLRRRVLNRPQISSDAFPAYEEAIEAAFGADVDYGMIIKAFGEDATTRKTVVAGRPDPRKISTSYVERSNATARQHCRRLTRKTYAFSKKLKHHRAFIDLFVAHYNLCRVHTTLRITLAMALGVTDHIWDIAELIAAARQPDDMPDGHRPAKAA